MSELTKRRTGSAVCATLIACATALTVLTGCQPEKGRATAVMSLPDGTIVCGEVESWYFEYRNQIEVKIGGTTYHVHAANIAIMEEDGK